MTEKLAILATIAGYMLLLVSSSVATSDLSNNARAIILGFCLLSAVALILGAMIVSLFIKGLKDNKPPSDSN